MRLAANRLIRRGHCECFDGRLKLGANFSVRSVEIVVGGLGLLKIVYGYKLNETCI